MSGDSRGYVSPRATVGSTKCARRPPQPCGISGYHKLLFFQQGRSNEIKRSAEGHRERIAAALAKSSYGSLSISSNCKRKSGAANGRPRGRRWQMIRRSRRKFARSEVSLQSLNGRFWRIYSGNSTGRDILRQLESGHRSRTKTANPYLCSQAMKMNKKPLVVTVVIGTKGV